MGPLINQADVSPDFRYLVDHLPLVIVGSLIMWFQWRNSQKLDRGNQAVDLGNKTNDVIVGKIDSVENKVNGQASLLANQKVVDEAAAKAAAVLASSTTVAAVLEATKAHANDLQSKDAVIADLTRQLAEANARKIEPS